MIRIGAVITRLVMQKALMLPSNAAIQRARQCNIAVDCIHPVPTLIGSHKFLCRKLQRMGMGGKDMIVGWVWVNIKNAAVDNF